MNSVDIQKMKVFPTVIVTRDPAQPERVVAEYLEATKQEQDRVLSSAQEVFVSWSKVATNPRCDLVARWLDQIEAKTEALAEVMTVEQGKPLAESRAEVGKALREARQMIGFARAHSGYELPARAAGWNNHVLRRPLGVVLAISPWNFPVLTPLRKLVPALAVGNTVVLKPSEFTPGAAMLMAEAANGILPEGVLSVLNGAGEVAKRLVADPRLAAVSFTGSVATGRKVAASAGQNLVPVSLELGGKNGVIVDRIENLDPALDAIVGAAFQCSGQRCTSISRVIAHIDILDDVRAGLLSRLQNLIPGQGMDEQTTLGPITTPAQLKRIGEIVDASIRGGATCLLGGKELQPESAPTGHFYAPTLLETSDVTNPAAQEEIFGPVLTLIPYADDDSAIEVLNNTEFGLTCAVFTDRLEFANRAVAEAASGMIHINCGTVPDDNMPFVGVKNSGLGTGSVGASTLDFFTSEHAAYITTN